MPASTKEIFQKKIADYKKTIDRYESEPDTKEGKKELLNRAKEHEEMRDHSMRQTHLGTQVRYPQCDSF